MVTRSIAPSKRKKGPPPNKRAQNNRSRLTTHIRHALNDFLRHALEQFPDDILQIVLYGSHARGEATPESDVDVMVVVNWKDPVGIEGFYNPKKNDPRYAKMLTMASDVSAKHHIDLSAWPITERDFNSDNPLAGEAKREGKVLWRRKGWKMADEEEEHPAKPRDPKTWLAMANEKLEHARKALQVDLIREAVSIAYYAMFYASRAALLSQGIYLVKHSASQAKFSELFIATGKVDKKFSSYLGKAQENREISDYEPFEIIARETAEETLAHAEAFVAKVKELIETQDQA